MLLISDLHFGRLSDSAVEALIEVVANQLALSHSPISKSDASNNDELCAASSVSKAKETEEMMFHRHYHHHQHSKTVVIAGLT